MLDHCPGGPTEKRLPLMQPYCIIIMNWGLGGFMYMNLVLRSTYHPVKTTELKKETILLTVSQRQQTFNHRLLEKGIRNLERFTSWRNEWRRKETQVSNTPIGGYECWYCLSWTKANIAMMGSIVGSRFFNLFSLFHWVEERIPKIS